MNVSYGNQAGYWRKSDNFPTRSQQTSGMLQYIVWTSLEVEGIWVKLTALLSLKIRLGAQEFSNSLD